MHYDLGGAHPLVGRSVPNFQLEGAATVGELLREGRGLLLDFSADSALASAVREYGAAIKYLSGTTSERLGLSAVLVRPDGIVAWASDHDPDHGELRQAAARWFVGAPAR